MVKKTPCNDHCPALEATKVSLALQIHSVSLRADANISELVQTDTVAECVCLGHYSFPATGLVPGTQLALKKYSPKKRKLDGRYRSGSVGIFTSRKRLDFNSKPVDKQPHPADRVAWGKLGVRRVGWGSYLCGQCYIFSETWIFLLIREKI